jgi:hypothetical protein
MGEARDSSRRERALSVANAALSSGVYCVNAELDGHPWMN